MPRPGPAEIEIAIFGPGYGEAIALHVGGQWIIVDSCIFQGEDNPAPLRYLQEIGVDPASEVSWVIATHWHDDHIRGLGRIFEACTSAQVGAPSALGSKPFASLLGHYRLPTQLQSTGVDEFNRIFREFERRRSAGMPQYPAWIGEQRHLVERRIQVDEAILDIRIMAASPSDEAFERSLVNLARHLPAAPTPGARPTPIGRVTNLEPNHTAIVLHASIGGISVLLGSDLEVSASPTDGWNRVTDVLRERGMSQVVKVPHHGSNTAHHGAMWDELLVPEPIAVITPFRRGRVALPTAEDVARIVSATSRAFITCRPQKLVMKHPEKIVQKMLTDVTTSPLVAQAARGGTVSLKYDLLAPRPEWAIHLSGGAVPLLDVLESSRRAVA